MKIKTLIIISLISMSAIACPDLNGSYYKCTTGDRVLDVMMGVNKAKLNVYQTGKDIIVDFLGEKTTLKVDETVELENYSESQKATIYSKVYSSCQNDILNIEEESKIVYDNGKIEQESSQTDAFIKNKKMHMNIVHQQDNGKEVKFNIVCKRKP